MKSNLCAYSHGSSTSSIRNWRFGAAKPGSGLDLVRFYLCEVEGRKNRLNQDGEYGSLSYVGTQVCKSYLLARKAIS